MKSIILKGEPVPGLKVYTAYQDMLDAIELGTKDLMIPYNSPSRGTLNDELNTGTSSRLEPKGKDKFGEWGNVNDPNPITQTTSVSVQGKADTVYRKVHGNGEIYLQYTIFSIGDSIGVKSYTGHKK